MFLGPESDRLALRELVDRYSDAINRRDADAWSSTWAEDAAWHFRGGERRGREAIVATWIGAMQGFSAVWFTAFPGAIDVDGDRATLTAHTLEHLVPIDGPPRFQVGLYADVAVRRGDGWRFAERRFTPREISL